MRQLIVLAFAIATAAPLLAQDQQGHPLITAYPGSKHMRTQVWEYEEVTMPLAPPDRNGKLPKSENLAGRLTRVEYSGPEGRSPIEKARNYEAGLKAAGFQIIFSCRNENSGCGRQTSLGRLGNFPSEREHFVAHLTRAAGDVWVVGHVGTAFTKLSILEVKPMQAGLVKVNADALGKGILAQGHVAVYGIFFDTGNADVKPESDETLKEIVALLKANPKLRLHVVGHTDNVGVFTSNLDLSRRRAAAVVAALTSRFGVEAARLRADGVGPLAPVASNSSEDGRARNRRVELVEQ